MKNLYKLVKIVAIIAIILGSFSAQAQISPYYFNSSGTASSPWTCRGQNPTLADHQDIGIVQSVAVHPSNLQTIYAGGGRFGGLWKTIDGGDNWANKTDVLGVAALGIKAIAIHPSNQNIVLAGTITRSYNWDYYDQGMGIIKSIDGGNTWQCTNIATFPTNNKSIKVIRFHPTNPNIVLAAGNKYIYQSTDTGTTWNIVFTNPVSEAVTHNSGPSFMDIEFLPNNPNIVLASTNKKGATQLYGAQLFLSTDAGNTWVDQTPSDALGSYSYRTIAIDVTPADPTHFYIMYQNNPSKLCIKKSTNGTSWTQISQFDPFASWGGYDCYEFEVSNSNVNTFYAGGLTMRKSVDGGNTWTRISEYWPKDLGAVPPHTTHGDIRSLLQLPATPSGDCLLMGNDGGVAKTTDGSTIWLDLNGNGLTISEYTSVGTFNSNNNLVGGLWDNGVKLYNANTNIWSQIKNMNGGEIGCDGGWVEVDYANDNIVYSMHNGSLKQSINGGYNYQDIGYGTGTYGGRFHLDLSDHNKVWVPINGNDNALKVYNGSSWTNKFTFPTATGKISAIHVAPSNGNIMYVAISGYVGQDSIKNKLFKSIDGGTTFSDSSAKCNAYRYSEINDFCVDPNNPDRVWAACGMYWAKADPSQGAYRVIYSANGGGIWSDISTGLPPFAVNHIVYREGSDDEIFIGTDAGVYRWNKQQATWECFNNGFPPVRVMKLVINNCKNKITAATWGRGIWEAPLPPLPTFTVTTSQTWNTSFNESFNQDILIPNGVTLTVKGRVAMCADRNITINPGGKLVVDGGTLTNACPDRMWRGIYVGGTIDQPQIAPYQGILELKNGAVIENARDAISTNEPDAANYPHGGIIKADSAIFRNNRRSVEFLDYTGGITNRISQNVSYFKKCTFTVDDNNLFAANGTSFGAHITMWAVTGVKIIGCTFENNITNMPDRKQAIGTIDAGYTIDEYCSAYNPFTICPQCINQSKPSTFKGFNTAIEALYTGTQYALTIDRSKFENNITGISIEGKNSFQISRLDMKLNTNYSNTPKGISLNLCTGYKVEENKIYSNSTDFSKGIYIDHAGTDENRIYRNHIYNTRNGITVDEPVIIFPAPPRSYPATGLQFVCNNLENNYDDITVLMNGKIRASQGSGSSGADNLFSYPVGNKHFKTDGMSPVSYYYDFSVPRKEPQYRSNLITLYSAVANPCKTTLCGGVLEDTIIHNKSSISALEEYQELNHKFAEMMSIFYAQGYDKILNDYYSGIIENEELLKEAIAYHESVLAVTEYMAAMSNEALFTLKTDSIIDLEQIRDWYDAIYTLNAKYALAETYYQLGNFESGLRTLHSILEMYKLDETEMIEHNNYVSLYQFKNSIRESGRTIAELNEAEIQQMLTFAGASHGLSSLMARNILCFFYEICIETVGGEREEVNGEKGEGAKGRKDEGAKEEGIKSPSNVEGVPEGWGSLYDRITLTPNPTTGELQVTSYELQVTSIEIYDVYGRKLNHLITSSSNHHINISYLSAGIYFVKITTETGEVVKKVVKQ